MTPVTQTIFGTTGPGPIGNCLQAAVASMLDLPLTQVPHFVADDNASGGELNWWTELRRFCRSHGHVLVSLGTPEPGELYLGAGLSPRSEGMGHVVIYRDDDQLVHDPHPDGTGLRRITARWMLRPLLADTPT